MKSETVKVSAVMPAPPKAVFDAWLSGKEHSEMTGSAAKGTAKVGSEFTAWDGYISGKNLELKSPGRILQSWRTTEFPSDAPDSRLEVLLEEAKGGRESPSSIRTSRRDRGPATSRDGSSTTSRP